MACSESPTFFRSNDHESRLHEISSENVFKMHHLLPFLRLLSKAQATPEATTQSPAAVQVEAVQPAIPMIAPLASGPTIDALIMAMLTAL